MMTRLTTGGSGRAARERAMGAGGWLLLRLALLGALLAAARGARLPGGVGAGAGAGGGPRAGPALKKDVFASRGWGAGGMPFSVLYLNPQQAPPAPPPAQPPAQLGPPVAGGAPRALAQRHVLQQPMAAARTMGGGGGAGGGGGGFEEVPLRAPARRHYSIIPQLFVSYGWGPLGK